MQYEDEEIGSLGSQEEATEGGQELDDFADIIAESAARLGATISTRDKLLGDAPVAQEAAHEAADDAAAEAMDGALDAPVGAAARVALGAAAGPQGEQSGSETGGFCR